LEDHQTKEEVPVKEEQPEHLQVEDGASSHSKKPFWRTLTRRIRETEPLENPGDREVHPLKDNIIGQIDDPDTKKLYTLLREIKAEEVKYSIRGRPGDKRKVNLLNLRADVVNALLKQRMVEIFPSLTEKDEYELQICQDWVVIDKSCSGNGLGGMLKKLLAKKMGHGLGLPPHIMMMLGGELPGMMEDEEGPFAGMLGLRLGRGFPGMGMPGMGEDPEH